MRRPGTAGPSLLLAAVACLAVGAPAAQAQGGGQPDSAHTLAPSVWRAVPAWRNRIVGVFDAQTYLPVEGADISDVLVGTRSLTSSTGNLSLIFLPEGANLVRIRKVGYESQTFLVTITPEDSSPITVVLSRVTELPAVVSSDSSPHYISAQLRGFAERQKAGFGYFINEAELRKRDDMMLADLLTARLPGINMVHVGGRRAYATSMRQPGCIQVYLDGVVLASAQDPQNKRVSGVDLSQFNVDLMGGIEFYSDWATVPAQYQHGECGALLLWTRER